MAGEFLGRAIAAASRRHNADPEAIEERSTYLAAQSDWKGTCSYCKRELIGTPAQLQAHRCREYEESLGSTD